MKTTREMIQNVLMANLFGIFTETKMMNCDNEQMISDVVERLNNIFHMIKFCDKEVDKICDLGRKMGMSEQWLGLYKDSFESFANRTNVMMDQFL